MINFYKLTAIAENTPLYTRIISVKQKDEKQQEITKFYEDIFIGFNGDIEADHFEPSLSELVKYESETKKIIMNSSSPRDKEVQKKNLSYLNKALTSLEEKAINEGPIRI